MLAGRASSSAPRARRCACRSARPARRARLPSSHPEGRPPWRACIPIALAPGCPLGASGRPSAVARSCGAAKRRMRRSSVAQRETRKASSATALTGVMRAEQAR
ncbi:MAG: hypothetical protein MZW92_04540 [Comamonadaceae bacterium]|nr:hypothetical protein [Comamonadaceae bacterium]